MRQREGPPIIDDLDLRTLRLFLTVCESGSMTGAARRLGITQSAVSQNVRHLEDLLGARLIDRDQRPLVPTRAGRSVMARAREILAAASGLATDLVTSTDARIATLRVGIVDSLVRSATVELIRVLRPHVASLRIGAGLSFDHAHALAARAADLIVTCHDLEDDMPLEVHPIAEERYLLIAPAGSAERLTGLGLAEIARVLPLVRYSRRSAAGRRVEQHLQRLRADIPEFVQVDTTDPLVDLVGQGVGWAITTPLCLASVDADLSRVATLPLPGPGFSRWLSVVARRGELGRLPTMVAEALTALVAERLGPRLQAYAPWDTEQATIP